MFSGVPAGAQAIARLVSDLQAGTPPCCSDDFTALNEEMKVFGVDLECVFPVL